MKYDPIRKETIFEGPLEKIKYWAIVTVFWIFIIAMIVALYFLNHFRWGFCK